MPKSQKVAHFPKSASRRDKREQDADDDVLSGLRTPEDVASISAETHRNYAKAEDKDNRSAKFEDYADAHYHASTNDACAVLDEREQTYRTQLEVEERNSAELRALIVDAPAIEAVSSKDEAGQTPEAQTTVEKISCRLDPRQIIEVVLLPVLVLFSLPIGAFGIADYLHENGPDKYAENWLSVLPYLAIPAVMGIGAELIIRSLQGTRARRSARKAVIFAWAASVVGVLWGFMGMAASPGAGLDSGPQISAEGVRFISQIGLEVTSISLVCARIFHILDAAWPDTYEAGRRRSALRAELEVLEAEIIAPLKLKIERCRYWRPSYEAHCEAFVKRECAAFEVACRRHDDLHAA